MKDFNIPASTDTVTLEPPVPGIASDAPSRPKQNKKRKLSREAYFSQVLVKLSKMTIRVQREKNRHNGRNGTGRLRSVNVPIMDIAGSQQHTLTLYRCAASEQYHDFDAMPRDWFVNNPDGTIMIVLRGSAPDLIDTMHSFHRITT